MSDLLPTDLAFIALPRISVGLFARILTRANSPVAPHASALATIPDGYNLDRALALAFFHHESTYGTHGIAKKSLNWGNLRSGTRAYKTESGFGFYHTWQDSLQDWCQLIKVRYIGRGLFTVRQVLKVYAPSSDGNNPVRYADQVCADVARWIQEDRLPTIPQIAHYRVRPNVTSEVRIRSAPRQNASILDVLHAGDSWQGVALAGALTTVAGFGTSSIWIKDADGRCVWAGLLEEVKEFN
jgi:hypothetical protein